MAAQLRYLLLQTRNAGDPMAAQEVRCFAGRWNAISPRSKCSICLAAPSGDKLASKPTCCCWAAADIIRRPAKATWLERALDALREIHRLAKPTFASCWGFQAMARAMGGRCVNDLPNAEVGTIELQLTDAGRDDPLFGNLPATFRRPSRARRSCRRAAARRRAAGLVARVAEQAFRFAGRPIYCTQFHPELDRTAMLERVIAYPEYVARIARMPYDEFVARVAARRRRRIRCCGGLWNMCFE